MLKKQGNIVKNDLNYWISWIQTLLFNVDYIQSVCISFYLFVNHSLLGCDNSFRSLVIMFDFLS